MSQPETSSEQCSLALKIFLDVICKAEIDEAFLKEALKEEGMNIDELKEKGIEFIHFLNVEKDI